jgi:hypothetical protein
MNDELINLQSPLEEDPELDRLLASLPRYSPAPDFADRVLSRVWQPEPAWVMRVQRAARSVFRKEHAWAWAGGLAATSTFSLVVTVTLVVNFWVHIETAFSVMSAGAIDWWRLAVGGFVQLLAWSRLTAEALGLTGLPPMAAGTVSALVLTGCAVGLQRTIRAYKREGTALHATR